MQKARKGESWTLLELHSMQTDDKNQCPIFNVSLTIIKFNISHDKAKILKSEQLDKQLSPAVIIYMDDQYSMQRAAMVLRNRGRSLQLLEHLHYICGIKST